MPSNSNNSNSGNNGSGTKEVELKIGERTFHKINQGVEENEIRSYVEELITQRNSLLKRQEHITALKELAERTVIEANNLSQLMMQKATEQAKLEAENIKSRAEHDGARLIEEKKAEAKVVAEKETEIQRIEAQRKVNSMREDYLKIIKEAIKTETIELTQRLQNDLLISIDSIKKNIMSIGVDFEKPSGTVVAQPIVKEIKKKPGAILSEGEKGALLNHIPWLEIEVLPPLDIENIMELISRLEDLPEVKTTDLLPETPNPLIRVFLNEPSALAELLKTLPQVEEVTDAADMGTTMVDEPGVEKRDRIRVVLKSNTSSANNGEIKKGTSATSK